MDGGPWGKDGGGGGKAPARGTRVVLHVKEADKTVAAAGWAVETTLKKYSAFVGFPVMLNGGGSYVHPSIHGHQLTRSFSSIALIASMFSLRYTRVFLHR